MGRIKKVAGPKHEATLSPALSDFVSAASKLPLAELPSHLKSFPFSWPYPRGDLYHWIPLLDLFDAILEEFNREYGLQDGPQTQHFGTRVLQKGVHLTAEASSDRSSTVERLAESSFGEDGDRELVEAILDFSRILLENCGNRSLYASSERLGHLLNTTSITLLVTTLRLACRLAIRYHHSRQRGSLANQHISSALLANHYNISLDHIQKLADTFKVEPEGAAPPKSILPGSPVKGKEKSSDDAGNKSVVRSRGDMLAAVRDDTSSNWDADESFLSAWGDVKFTFQPSDFRTSDRDTSVSTSAVESPRDTDTLSPTPIRRTPAISRGSGGTASESDTVVATVTSVDDVAANGGRSIYIPYSTVTTSPLEDILKLRLPEIPKENHYDFLNRLRVAKYFTQSLEARRHVVSVRILAVTNLAYVYPESTFQHKVLKPDSDEPRRAQIVQQLAELIHPPDNDRAGIPLALKTIAVGALESLSKHKNRAVDVCSALSVNVSHGVLLFILRKTASDLASESQSGDAVESEEWEEALLSLLDALPSSTSRTADSLVGAGLLEILVDVLRLRTAKAERVHHKVLTFLNSLVHGVRDAFQAFVNAKGLDAVSALISWEVSTSISRVSNGLGLSDQFKSQVTDYQMPYFQQQTLRWLFRFVNHMMTHGSANFDRLLRNLIDSPPLLSGLRDVLANAKIFGSTIWSGAVNILSSFIHNEPTSYAVIAEAGLSRSFLESISKFLKITDAVESPAPGSSLSTVIRKCGTSGLVSITVTRPGKPGADVDKENTLSLCTSPDRSLAHGILPATDAISAIPSAFGAICLNTTGLDMFLASGALESFFEIFESPDHVRSMAAEANLPKNLGQHFDELVRHHPRLKSAIMTSVILMCARLSYYCESSLQERGNGARLVLQSIGNDGDTIMADPAPQNTGKANAGEQDPSVSAYIGVTAKFLSGFFDNHSLCTGFILGGGLDFLLDLTTAPSLPYNFNNQPESQHLSHVLHLLVEQKPHLVLPSMVTRALDTLAVLEPLTHHNGSTAFFAEFVPKPAVGARAASESGMEDGTNILKGLVGIHTLCNVLQEAFMHVPYSTRSHHTLFSQVNLTDVYIRLSKELGRLYRVCVWEEILLQNTLSDDLKESTRVQGYGMGSDEADEIFGFINSNAGSGAGQTDVALAADQGFARLSPTHNQRTPLMKSPDNAYRKNVQSLRFLLSQVPSSITPFLQGLGRSLVLKRRADPYQRQNAYMVADTLAEVALDHLRFSPPESSLEVKDRYAYWIVSLTSLSQLLIEGPLERPHSQCLTLVLQAFRNREGLRNVNGILDTFFEKVKELTEENASETTNSASVGLLNCLCGGMRLILVFYSQITSSKYITDSSQSQALLTPDRDKNSPYYFNPGQFLVELRTSVISAVRPIWDSPAVEGLSSSVLKCIVDILRTTLEAEQEHGAFSENNNAVERSKPEYRQFSIAPEKEISLKEKTSSADLIREALYRCFNHREYAEEYCDVRSREIAIPKLSIPPYDVERGAVTPGIHQELRRRSSNETIPDAEGEFIASETTSGVPMQSSEPATTVSNEQGDTVEDLNEHQVLTEPISRHAPDTDVMADGIDNILNLSEGPRITETQDNADSPAPIYIASTNTAANVTVEHLDKIRVDLRKNLIDRILEILGRHDDISFDLADLILIATSRAQDASALRKEIGETLVQSLISFQHKEDFRPKGATIASYANLIAIVIQDRDFYEATIDEVKDNMDSLLNFVKVYPDSHVDEKSPWVAQVLLVIEKLLAEDVQPEQIKWTPPFSDAPASETPIAQIGPPLVSNEEKMRLFQSLVEILPRIGKDQSLALSVVRILVILTRNREVADRLGDKRNLQRLFVMVKQLAGISNEKFQSTFLLLLRHVIEDNEIIRQIMRSEIRGCFQNRPSRPLDTTAYVRNMHALVLRAPDLFLEISSEMLKLEAFDPNARSQTLLLKDSIDQALAGSDSKVSNSTVATTVASGTESTSEPLSDVKVSTEGSPAVEISDKSRTSDSKFPIVKHPDGVIHFLLSQLLSYKDIDDKGSVSNVKEGTEHAMTQNVGAAASEEAKESEMAANPDVTKPDKKTEKSEFKAEQHPIYIYRCFILQCLTELLMSYTQAKVEFLNFSRKPSDLKGSTPSKPRSGVLNYILGVLVPLDTLDRPESVAFRKSIGTSNWAMSTIVALCVKTPETFLVNKRDVSEEDSNAELLFVRKFVLDNVLKIFKDVQASTEQFSSKYARLLSFADLLSRLLNGRVLPVAPVYAHEPQSQTIKGIGKIMFEKSFIAALTSSIADVDLNYPNSKRAVKYILRPLKALTQTAIHLSEASELSITPSPPDEDEISTATSTSEPGEEREETPDLFRHSTLGILDPAGREDESSSESDDEDEDMYDDEYDDGVEYEEEIERDHDEVISDDDEDLGDAGPVEGLTGDVDMDVEVVLEDDEGDGSDEELSEDSDPMEEEGDDVELIDELNGDDESLSGGVGNGWGDEDEDLDLDDPYSLDSMASAGLPLEQDVTQRGIDGDPARDLVLNLPSTGSAIGGGPIGDIEMDVEDRHYMGGLDVDLNHEEDGEEDDEEDDDDDEDDDELEDEDIVYPDYDDEDGEVEDASPWSLGTEGGPSVRGPRGHNRPSQVRRIMNPWSMFTPGYSGTDRVPNYRTHRGGPGMRGPDDGLNPLLQRNGSGTSNTRRATPIVAESVSPIGDFVNLLSSRHRHDGVVSLLNGMMTTVGVPPPFGAPHTGALHLHLDSNGSLLPFPRDLQALMNTTRPTADSGRSGRDESSFVPIFYPTQTPTRWSEEARLLFGSSYTDKTQRVVNSLLQLLVPPALEEERLKKEMAEEEMRQHRQREENKREQLLAKEQAERDAEEKRREEREVIDPTTLEANANGEAETTGGDAMEGVEVTTAPDAVVGSEPSGATDAAANGSSDQTERVRAVFRGREVDITHLGIDLEYLDALPEELREEVLMQQLAEQRSQAAVSGEAPTDINREFLDALPPDIRQEILQQEAQDRRRREREQVRRQATANGVSSAARAEEMDTASFLASLDPGLRNAVLLDQDEDIISQLPAAIAAEARALGAERTGHRWGASPRGQRHPVPRSASAHPAIGEEEEKKPARKQIVQMLDKAGVATLLRLLFVSQQGSAHDYLNSILENASRNTHNRAEILNILLSILQEGSSDANSVERSFMQLTLRAKQQNASKTPQGPKRPSTGPFAAPLNSEMTPLMVIQQCLSALVHLTDTNAHVPAFFLSEHEQPIGLKSKTNKKGKYRETRESRFAINTLLGLLDRRLITESAGCMEQLSSLMQNISQPLMIFRREMDRLQDTLGKPTDNSLDHIEGAANAAPVAAQTTLPSERSAAGITSEQPAHNQPATEAKSLQKEALPKKLRNFQLPAIPEQNYRLVVSILGARECSSKTFRDTLSTINNLSTIPGARDIFGRELVKVSQQLGDTITKDLNLLVAQIQGTNSSDDVHGLALSKFSPSSSNQAKFLRVLTALDYLFDPSRSSSKSNESDPNNVKEDLVSALYESSTFGPLWSRLSDCLKCMRQRDNMLNTATVLLPLVEALMVVCKNTTLGESSSKGSKEFTISSPAPESAIESLFFRFTEEHRKILNDLVRNNPRLMSGTFSLLVKNPKVLEFDNKRNYFTRRLHARGDLRHTQPSLQLSIRRDQTFLDSYRSLYFKTPEEMKYGKLSIRFHGEEGVDAGGVTREWFQTMSRQMFNADYALFVPVASDRTTFHPNRLSHVNEEHLFYFKFIGRVIGKALYEGRALDCHFSRAVYKRILGKSVSVKDMETLDLEYYKSLLWMLENDISDIITETFSIETEEFGVTEIIDLVGNGRNIPVTEENKQEYVQLVVEYRLTGSVQSQLQEFLKGFHDIVPAELIAIFNEQELELLISGLPDIDVDDWRNHTEYHNYSASSAQIQWFWRAVRSFDKEEQAKLLQFVTGTAKVPLNGFKELEGMNGFSRFNIHRDYGNKNRLPSSHTCFNQIDLPEYNDYETLRRQLYTAMTAGSEYFGFA